MDTILTELSWRGLVKDHTDREELETALQEPLALYAGFDPTAPSLHVGHLLQVITLERFRRHGHRTVALLGGATAQIGDPSGRRSERPLQDTLQIQLAKDALRNQLTALGCTSIVDNLIWWKELDTLSFLRDVGKHFSINDLLHSASVQSRLAEGISFTEFAYSLLQGQDFAHLHNTLGITLQIGGSDQWGNITSGVSLVRKTTGKAVHGLTVPLLLDRNGEKMGKSTGKPVWLDPARTTPLEFFQFFLGVDDQEVIPLLEKLTFLNQDEINALRAGMEDPLFRKERRAHRALARELTFFVHGQKGLSEALEATEALWGKKDTQDAIGVPMLEVTFPKNVMEILLEGGLIESKGAGRRLMKDGGIRLHGEKLLSERDLAESDLQDGALRLSVGKKKHLLARPQQ